ncbi:MAG TPA: hypothetical protein VGF55_21465 [Gemmataceae bacterium]|jgi:hypothetical protein
MAIDVECPGCRAAFPVPDRLGGRLIRCTTCREEFRVGGGRPAYDDEDDYGEPRPRRRRPSSPLVPLLIVGGILGGCLVVAAIAVVLLAGRDKAANPVLVRRQQAFPQGPGRQAAPNGVVPNVILTPPRPAGQGGRPAEPVEGPILVTLSNPRRAESMMPDRRAYQVDYQTQAEVPDENVRYYLVVKVPGGISEGLLPMLRLTDKGQGTLAFAFFPGRDPGQGFDLWIERATIGKARERKRVSAVVTLD